MPSKIAGLFGFFFSFRGGDLEQVLGLPMAIPHFALVVGFGGTTIVAALLLASDVAELFPARRGKRAEGA